VENQGISKLPWSRQIGNKVLLMAVIAGILPMLILGGTLAVKMRRDLISEAMIAQSTMTGAIQHGINSLLTGYVRQLELLAEDPEIQGGTGEEQTQAIFRFLDLNPMFFSCFVYNASGTITSVGFRNRNRGLDEKYLGHKIGGLVTSRYRPAYEDAVLEVYKSGKPAFCPYIVRSIDQKMFLLIVPIRGFTNPDEIVGAVSCAIALDGPDLQEIVTGFPVRPREILVLLDRSGTVLAARGDVLPEGFNAVNLPWEQIASEPRSPISIALDAEPYFGIIAHLPVTSGFLLTARPRREVFAFLDQFLLNLALVVVVALVLTVGMGFLLISAVAEKISRLVEGIHLVAQGVITHRVAIGGDDELSEAGKAFNEMAASLEKHRLMDDLWAREWTEPAGENPKNHSHES
jgi:HAMP domain-containing protein